MYRQHLIRLVRRLLGTSHILERLDRIERQVCQIAANQPGGAGAGPLDGVLGLEILPGTPYSRYATPIEYLPSRNFRPRWGDLNPSIQSLHVWFAEYLDDYQNPLAEMSANRSELAAIPRDFDERNLPNPAWCGVPYSPFDGAALYTIVKNFVYRAVNDRAVVVFEGHAKRNYLRVRDVAHAFLHALDNFERMKNEPYNVGLSDANLSKLELCAEIQKHLPKFVYLEAPVGEDPDKRDYIVSNAKIDRTGFKPAYSLEMGIRELIKGYTILRNSRYANMS